MGAVLLLYPAITSLMSKLALRCLPEQAAAAARIVREPFLTGPISAPDVYGKFPSLELCFAFFLFTTAIIALVPRSRLPLPIIVWIGFAAAIGLVSAVIFGFWPPHYPYYIRSFSMLYMRMEIGLWLWIPTVMSAALAPLPAALPTRLAGLVLTLLYMVLTSIVRYAFIIAFLVRYSYLFMAFLYFVIGPFLDFVLVVGLYSVFASRISRRIRVGLGVWRWLY